jgi:hypothetical protein
MDAAVRRVNITASSPWDPFCFVVWRVAWRKLQLEKSKYFCVLYGLWQKLVGLCVEQNQRGSERAVSNNNNCNCVITS